MRGQEHDACPSCASPKIALQGRFEDGRPVRELVCISCKHTWPAEDPEPVAGPAAG